MGIALEGYTSYTVGAELLASIGNVQLSAYHQWPGVEITLYAFYQTRRLWVSPCCCYLLLIKYKLPCVTSSLFREDGMTEFHGIL